MANKIQDPGPFDSVAWFVFLRDRWLSEAPTGKRRTSGALAETLGVHPVTVSRWAGGTHEVPGKAIAWLLGATGLRIVIDSEGSSIVDGIGAAVWSSNGVAA